MKTNINSRTYNFANCLILPLRVGGDVRASGVTSYLKFYDTIGGIVKRGGMERRPLRPTLEELKAMGVVA